MSRGFVLPSLILRATAPLEGDDAVRAQLSCATQQLARNFKVLAVNRVWLADITYIATEEGWLYLGA